MIRGKGVILPMKKNILATAAAILLVGASAFSALTFTGCSCTGKGNKIQTTTVAANAGQAKTYEASDLLVCEGWIGKMNTQIGMESYTANNQIDIKGKLFNEEATGYAVVQKGGNVISNVIITAATLSYDTAKDELTKKYGDPIKDEDKTCTFRTGSNSAILSQNGNGVTLEFK